jgi:CRP-like cAMP-binding protein
MAQRGVSGENLLLGALSPGDLALIEPHLTDMSCEHGALLHDRGERIRHVAFPRSGMISLLVVMRSGEEVEVATVGREGAVGIGCGFGVGRASMRAVMQVPGIVAKMPAPQFQKAIRESRTLAETMARYSDMVLAQAQQSVACNALHQVEPRLCRWLLQVHDRCDGETLPLTQEFLAQMLGVRRTTVTLAARALQDAGMIRYRRGQIELLDLKALKESACECYEVIQSHTAQITAKPR